MIETIYDRLDGEAMTAGYITAELKFDGDLCHTIIAPICRRNGVTMAEVLGYSRKRGIVRARHDAMYAVRTLTGMTLEAIGDVFHRDHTTVVHAIKAVEARDD